MIPQTCSKRCFSKHSCLESIPLTFEFIFDMVRGSELFGFPLVPLEFALGYFVAIWLKTNSLKYLFQFIGCQFLIFCLVFDVESVGVS